ncbi:hypothetical protein Q9L58_008427 [Maublancomyces gigas]|uniref:F-box domain-containing protein n=1 Tax=Discina gigas TaxID=1032678 RepID=A0ABR3G9N8_9PEZI
MSQTPKSLAGLGADIILLHLVPFLPYASLLALASIDKNFHAILGPLRFCQQAHPILIRKSRGFILDVLSPASLGTITHLELSGTGFQYLWDCKRIFTCRILTSVVSVAIWAPIPVYQQSSFERFARQLKKLEQFSSWESPENLLDTMEPRTLNHLQVLYFEHPFFPRRMLDPGFGLGVMFALTKFTYLSLYHGYLGACELDGEVFIQDAGYISTCHILILQLSNAANFPALRLVEFSLPRPANSDIERRRDLLVEAWNASLRHRKGGGPGWRLGSRSPHEPRFSCFGIDPSHCRCNSGGFALFINTTEVAAWTQWASRQDECTNMCERIENYMVEVHVNVAGRNISRVSAPGVSLAVGQDLNAADISMAPLVSWISKDTHCITLNLTALWSPELNSKSKFLLGELPSEASYFRIGTIQANISSLRINIGRATLDASTTCGYDQNIPARILRIFALPLWGSLRTLVLPAAALQGSASRGAQYTAKCGEHIGLYSLDWLASCELLQCLIINEWRACIRCDLPGAASLEGELSRFLPRRVEKVVITGCFFCGSQRLLKWNAALVYGGFIGALREARRGGGLPVDLNIGCLLVVPWSGPD